MSNQTSLTKEEVEERVALLKKFKSLLEQQRKKFQDYLFVLEKQEEAITQDNVDAVVSQTELEQSIVSEIVTIQKVIDPFELMYKDLHPNSSEDEIPSLKTNLDQLKEKVLIQNEKNRSLLKTHMSEVRKQIKGLSNPYAKKTSVYSNDKNTGSIIDIEF